MSDKNVVVLCRGNGFGVTAPSDADFGHSMMELFLHTLESLRAKPSALCFVTEGVRLACKGSPVAPSLQLLAGMGVRVVLCRTCLEHYRLADQVVVGEVGGMKDILALCFAADSVMTV